MRHREQQLHRDRGGHSDPGKELRGHIRETPDHPPHPWNDCVRGFIETRVQPAGVAQ